ncbi:MAG TPA: prepilin-type N-terminal cleavage/methylation domain-containing protein [Vicinamibacterales bacterium]|nr:prepilin-type N-terminal cleavage/methylation domain-containing protein [Vicinamibacterales bacterium]
MKHPLLRDRRGYSLIEVLTVVAITGVVMVIAVPMMGNLFGFFRLSGDARSISNAIAVAKMRAASDFSRVRIYVDLSGRTFKTQAWDKLANSGAGAWKTEGGLTYLSSNVVFGYGAVGTAPPSSQGTIGMGCTTGTCTQQCTADDGTFVSGTACVMFNSRGVPVDNTFAPTASDAFYVTDGSAVYGITVSATGMIRSWRTPPASTPTWVKS